MIGQANPVSSVLCLAFTVATWLLLARVIVSWLEFFRVRIPSTGLVRTAYDLLFKITEPGLRQLRRVVPPAGMFDMSVLVAFVILFVGRIVVC
jgi:YggT family protein